MTHVLFHTGSTYTGAMLMSEGPTIGTNEEIKETLNRAARMPGYTLYHSKSPFFMQHQCTMQLSLCKMGNWGFKPASYHCPHFIAVQLFQTEIFGDCQLHSFTFEKYLGTS